jgi:hypothetical protein
VNRDKRKVWVIGWSSHDNYRSYVILPLAERHDPRIVLPLGRGVVGYPKPDAQRSLVALDLGGHSHRHICPRRLSDRCHGCLVYR